jgi:hypothetical protein
MHSNLLVLSCAAIGSSALLLMLATKNSTLALLLLFSGTLTLAGLRTIWSYLHVERSLEKPHLAIFAFMSLIAAHPAMRSGFDWRNFLVFLLSAVSMFWIMVFASRWIKANGNKAISDVGRDERDKLPEMVERHSEPIQADGIEVDTRSSLTLLLNGMLQVLICVAVSLAVAYGAQPGWGFFELLSVCSTSGIVTALVSSSLQARDVPRRQHRLLGQFQAVHIHPLRLNRLLRPDVIPLMLTLVAAIACLLFLK